MKQIQSVMDCPAVYRVKVEGSLPLAWSDRLMGMNITAGNDDDVGTSIIIGRLPDQAALSGILNVLYENRYALLSVECLEKG